MSLARKLSVIATLYVIEGFPMGVHDLWDVYLLRHGVSRTEIGVLMGALGFAWSLKVLWSPLVDRFGDQRHWIAGSLLVMAGCLVSISVSPVERHVTLLLWVAMILYCASSATQDIAIDAYTIGLTDRGEEGPVNGVRNLFYRIGQSVLARSLFFTTAWVGWSGAFLVAAGISAAMAFGALACPSVAVPVTERRRMWPALRRWLTRPGIVPVLAFVLLYRVGDRAMAAMTQPFWVNIGLADDEIGFIGMILGLPVGVISAFIGARVVTRLGIARALWILGALALLSNLAYVVAALPGMGRGAVYGAAIVESLCGWLQGIGFMSYLMRICEKEHAAVQYALLTALYALTGSLVSMPSGWFVDHIGYAAYFALTAAFALPAFFFLPAANRWIEGDD